MTSDYGFDSSPGGLSQIRYLRKACKFDVVMEVLTEQIPFPHASPMPQPMDVSPALAATIVFFLSFCSGGRPSNDECDASGTVTKVVCDGLPIRCCITMTHISISDITCDAFVFGR